MREFILRARKAKTNPSLDLNRLPGEGKIDSVCATIANAIWLSGDVRRDVAIHAVLEGPDKGPKTISFFGSEIRGLRHDERSIASYIQMALQKGAHLQLNEEAHVRTGIKVAKKSFERLLWEKSGRQIIALDKGGQDIRDFIFDKNFVAIIGSPEGLPPKTLQLLDSMHAKKISLGPRMLFASHCPVLIHNELDRRQI
jgi:tRNA (pseudouridine54-N1)-methyltransferase